MSGLRFAQLVSNETNTSPHDGEASPELNLERDLGAAMRRDLLHCTQYSGDVMYVPTLWGHATLNVRQSIGVAHEFSVEPFCME